MDKDGVVGHYNWHIKSEIRPHLEEIVAEVHDYMAAGGESKKEKFGTLFHLREELHKIDAKVNDNLKAKITLYISQRKKVEVSVGIMSHRNNPILFLAAEKDTVGKKVLIGPSFHFTTISELGKEIKKGKIVKVDDDIAIPLNPIFYLYARNLFIWQAMVGDEIINIMGSPSNKIP